MITAHTAALFDLHNQGRRKPSAWEQLVSLLFWSSSGRRWILWDTYVGILAAWSAFNLSPYGPQPNGLATGCVFGIITGLACWLCGVPRPETNPSRYELLSVSLMGTLLGMILCMLIGLLIAYVKIGRWIWVIFICLTYAGISIPRLLISNVEAASKHRMLIYGAGRAGSAIVKELTALPGIRIVGFIDDDRQLWQTNIMGTPCLGGIEQARALCAQLSVQLITVATTERLSEEHALTLLTIRHMGIEIMDIPELYERFLHRVPVDYISPQWLVSGQRLAKHSMMILTKRFFDVGCSLLGLMLTLPAWPLIALLVKFDSPGPVFFSQWRMGFCNRPFQIFKFRTMIVGAEEQGARWAETSDQRITPIGKWLRLTRIDELPQLLNVLWGHMSIIGPRPERPEFIAEIERTIPYYDQRYLVRPGITGWAQVQYRYGASLEDTKRKLEYDLFYIRNLSFRLDLQILLRTLVLLMKGSR